MRFIARRRRWASLRSHATQSGIALWNNLRPSVELLEDRRLLTTFVVNNTADDGPGSLRQAILLASVHEGEESIVFNIPTSDPNFVNVDFDLSSGDLEPDVFVIRPLSPLPYLGARESPFGVIPGGGDGGTTIDGRTQAAYTGDTNPQGPEIVLDGSLAGDANGLTILDTDNCRIFGLNIQQFTAESEFPSSFLSFGAGIAVFGGDHNWLAANFIGTDALGTRAKENRFGVLLYPSSIDVIPPEPPFFPDGVEPIVADSNLVGTDGDGIDDELERNVVSGNERGVQIFAGSNNIVAGNFIGTSATGDFAVGNRVSGVTVQSGRGADLLGTEIPAAFNRIGTDGDGVNDAAERNVISGNDAIGVLITGAGALANVVAGNHIGTDALGAFAIGNSTGLVIATDDDDPPPPEDRLQSNRIATNVISGNTNGIKIEGPYTRGNSVAANLVGTNAAESAPLGNNGNGISIEQRAHRNSVVANDITATRFGPGVSIGDLSSGNAVRSNAIFANFGLAIDLQDDGVTLNDPQDLDTGPNHLQNFPELTAAASVGGTTTIAGRLNSTPGTEFTLEFFANAECDPSGHGEGERLLGSALIMTDSLGNATFVAAFETHVPAGQLITATATDPTGNTSEFSACRFVSHIPIGLFARDVGQLTLLGTNGVDAVELKADQGGGIVVSDIANKRSVPIIDLARGNLCNQQQGACPTIFNTNQIDAFFGEGDDFMDVNNRNGGLSLVSIFIFGQDGNDDITTNPPDGGLGGPSGPGSTQSFGGGPGRDILRIIGTIRPELYEIVGVELDPPVQEIRVTDLATNVASLVRFTDVEETSIEADDGDDVITVDNRNGLLDAIEISALGEGGADDISFSWWGHCNGWSGAALSEKEPIGGLGLDTFKLILGDCDQNTHVAGVQRQSGSGFEVIAADADRSSPPARFLGEAEIVIVEEGGGDDTVTTDNTNDLLRGMKIGIFGQGGNDDAAFALTSLAAAGSDAHGDFFYDGGEGDDTATFVGSDTTKPDFSITTPARGEFVGGSGNDKLVIDGTATDQGQQFLVRAGQEAGSAEIAWSDIGTQARLFDIFSVGVESTGIKGGDGPDAVKYVATAAADRIDVTGVAGNQFDSVVVRAFDAITGSPIGALLAHAVELQTIEAGFGDDLINLIMPSRHRTRVAVFGQEGNDSTGIKPAESGEGIDPAEPNEPGRLYSSGGPGHDLLRIIGSNRSELFEIVGVAVQDIPDPELRITDLETNALTDVISFFEFEEFELDAKGGPNKVVMSDHQASLGDSKYTITTGDDDDNIAIDITRSYRNLGLNVTTGNGADTFRMTAGPIDKAQPQLLGTHVNVDGGGNPDDIRLQFSEEVHLSAGSSFTLGGGGGGDTIELTSRASLENADFVLNGGPEDDKIEFLAQWSSGPLDLSVNVAPGAGRNLVSISGGPVGASNAYVSIQSSSEASTDAGFRTLLDVIGEAELIAFDLDIIGTSGADVVEVDWQVPMADMILSDIVTGGGDDLIKVQSDVVARLQNHHIDAGGGDDETHIAAKTVAAGSFGSLTCRDEDWFVDSGAGNDKVFSVASGIAPIVTCVGRDEPSQSYSYTLGDGHDVIDVETVVGSAKQFLEIDGGDGNNTSRIKIAENEQPRPQDRTLFNFNYFGGDEIDVVDLDTHFTAPVIEQNVQIATAGGDDQVEIRGTLTSDASRLGRFQSFIALGAGRDLVLLRETFDDPGPPGGDPAPLPPGFFKQTILGGGGDDVVDVSIDNPQGAFRGDPEVIVGIDTGADDDTLKFVSNASGKLKLDANLGDGVDKAEIRPFPTLGVDVPQGFQPAAIALRAEHLVIVGGPNSDRFEIFDRRTDFDNEPVVGIELASATTGQTVANQTSANTGQTIANVEWRGGQSLVLKGDNGDDEFRVLGPLPAILDVFGEGGDNSYYDAHVHTIAEWFFDNPINLFAPRKSYHGEGADRVTLVTSDLDERIEDLGTQDPQAGDRHLHVEVPSLGYEVDIVFAGIKAITVDTGGGNDQVRVRDPDGRLAGIDWNIKTGAGADLIDVLAATGTGPALWNIDAGADNDLVNMRFSRPVSGDVRVAISGQEGNDLIALELFFAQLGLGAVDIKVSGGANNDLVSLLARGPSDPQRTRLLIDGGLGFDIGIGTPNVDILNCEIIIGGRRRR